MPKWLQTLITIAVLIAVVLVAMALLSFGTWLRAKKSDVCVTFWKLIGMRMRKANVARIVTYAIEAKKAGIELKTDRPSANRVGLVSAVDYLEAHDLAGGNIQQVIDAMIQARESNIDLPWDHACAVDLAGRDILSIVRVAAQNGKTVGEVLYGNVDSAEKYERDGKESSSDESA